MTLGNSLCLTALSSDHVDIGPVAEEKLDCGDLTVGRGPHHHGQAVTIRSVNIISSLSQPVGQIILVQVSLASSLEHIHIADSCDVLGWNVSSLEVGQDCARLGSGGYRGAGGPECGHLGNMIMISSQRGL